MGRIVSIEREIGRGVPEEVKRRVVEGLERFHGHPLPDEPDVLTSAMLERMLTGKHRIGVQVGRHSREKVMA
jgi:hypothetical protein